MITRSIVSQGHLTPMSLNSQPVHWDYDHSLRLYPLPDLVVIGDKYESYQDNYKGCIVVNPGPFCENGFEFISYIPHQHQVQSCALP